MTRWAFVTVGLYVALFLALTIPVIAAAAFPSTTTPMDYLGFYALWQYWVILAVFALAQLLMLIVPVRSRADLVMKKRHMATHIIAASFAMALLVFGVIASLLAAFYGDSFGADNDTMAWVMIVGLPLLSWVLWFFVFRRFSRVWSEPSTLVDKVTAVLYHGSIAELVIAVTSHIIVRRRGDCSAPVGTFAAMCAGLAVLMLSFGPGVFYLFAARMKRMTPKRQKPPAA